MRGRRLVTVVSVGFCSLLALGWVLASQGEELARELEEAKQPYLLGSFPRAVQALGEVIAKLEAQPDLPKQQEMLVDAYFHLGLTYFALNDRESAAESFTEVVRRDPDFTIDRERYAPRIVEQMEEARRQLRESQQQQAAAGPAERPTTVTARTAEKEGGSKKVLMVAGIGGAGAVAGVVALSGGSETTTSVPVAACTLPGGFEFTMDFAWTGTFSCGVRNQLQRYYLRNNSCDPLTVTGLTVTASTGESSQALVTALSTVPSGETLVIRDGTPAGESSVFCCIDCPGSRADEVNVTETYRVSTNQGDASLTNDFTVTGVVSQCPPCDQVVTHFSRKLPSR